MVATGAATTALSVGQELPTEITKSMRAPGKGKNTQAVGRILQIEFQRLRRAAVSHDDPIESAKRVRDGAVNRGPLIRWALDIWIRGQLGLKRAENQGDTIVQTLRALELELASQIKFGLTTSPLRVAKLACSVVFVSVFAWLSNFRRFSRFTEHVRRTWPQTVEHLAAVLERNFEIDPEKSFTVSSRARRALAKWRAIFPLAPSIENAINDPLRPLVDSSPLSEMFPQPFFDPAITKLSLANQGM